MKKVVYPVVCRTGDVESRAFAEITFENGKLRIHGVIGPMRNGNCRGFFGQCVDEIRAGNPVAPWTREMVDKFCDIWDEWHLNDRRPYCEHQKALGWLRENEHPDGILCKPCPVCGYKYGTS